MTHTEELVAIIARETRDLEAGEDRATAAATILAAASRLLDALDPEGVVCARLTHHNGHLIDRYRGGHHDARAAGAGDVA